MSIRWKGGARVCQGAFRHDGEVYHDFSPENEASLIEQGKADPVGATPKADQPKTFLDHDAKAFVEQED